MLKCSMHITKSACSSFFPFLALSSVLIHLWLALLLCGCAKALSFHFYTTIIIWCALSVNCSVRLGRAWRWRHIYFIIPKQHPIHNSTESSSTHTHTHDCIAYCWATRCSWLSFSNHFLPTFRCSHIHSHSLSHNGSTKPARLFIITSINFYFECFRSPVL